MSMEKVFVEIREERARQDLKWGGPEHDDGHNRDDWITCIRSHTTRATPLGSRGEDTFRGQLVRVAALAVAAIQAQDRRVCHGLSDNPLATADPCPFCGGLPDTFMYSDRGGDKDVMHAVCTGCGACGPGGGTDETAAVLVWNQRGAPES